MIGKSWIEFEIKLDKFDRALPIISNKCLIYLYRKESKKVKNMNIELLCRQHMYKILIKTRKFLSFMKFIMFVM